MGLVALVSVRGNWPVRASVIFQAAERRIILSHFAVASRFWGSCKSCKSHFHLRATICEISASPTPAKRTVEVLSKMTKMRRETSSLTSHRSRRRDGESHQESQVLAIRAMRELGRSASHVSQAECPRAAETWLREGQQGHHCERYACYHGCKAER